MSVDWMEKSVRIIISVCAVAAVAECAAGEERAGEGLRMICGTVAAASLLRMAADCINGLF